MWFCRMNLTSPHQKTRKNNKKDEDDDEDERSEMSPLEPRNISFGSNRARTPMRPAKRSKATPGTGRGGVRWPPGDSDGGAEDDGANDDDERTEDDGDERTEDSGAGSYGELDIAIDIVKRYGWLLSWTSEYSILRITPTAVFNTLCL